MVLNWFYIEYSLKPTIRSGGRGEPWCVLLGQGDGGDEMPCLARSEGRFWSSRQRLEPGMAWGQSGVRHGAGKQQKGWTSFFSVPGLSIDWLCNWYSVLVLSTLGAVGVGDRQDKKYQMNEWKSEIIFPFYLICPAMSDMAIFRCLIRCMQMLQLPADKFLNANSYWLTEWGMSLYIEAHSVWNSPENNILYCFCFSLGMREKPCQGVTHFWKCQNHWVCVMAGRLLFKILLGACKLLDSLWIVVTAFCRRPQPGLGQWMHCCTALVWPM